MSDSKRQCSKCQFFQTAQLSGNGWCTHPKRQVASDLKILVRERELACRNSWGEDLWVDAVAGTSAADVVSPPRKGLFYVTNRVDDEITSVVDTTAKGRPEHGDSPPHAAADDVVTFNAVRRDDTGSRRANDHNAPAIADQAERARLMARGNKDAILKARERHAERRRPARETLTGEEGGPQTDQVLAAQDREHYARDLSGADRAPIDDYRNTPPVPRAEVEAKGNALSPASGTDDRFDSVARLNPDVDLTQLRGFLNHSPAGRNGSGGDHSVVTSYDLVLKRAREIKAAGEVEREHHRSTLNGRTVSQPAPEPDPASASATQSHVAAPAAPVSRSRPRVVWDVEGERLSIAFERARVAIDQPVHLSPIVVESATNHDDRSYVVAADPGNVSPILYVHDHKVDSADLDSSSDWIDVEDAHGQFAGLDSPYHDDDPSALVDFEPEVHAPAVESPRGSWWRSLNFGRKRRYRTEAIPARPEHVDDDDGYAAHEYTSAETDAYDHVDDDGDEPFAPEAWYDDASAQEQDDEAGVDLVFATSEESWRQDEWEFPEPQPMEWHESRAQLLESSATRVTAVATAARSSAFAAGQPDTNALAADLTDIPTQRPAASSYSFDGPAGMDAFRTALFGESHSPRASAGSSYHLVTRDDLVARRHQGQATSPVPSFRPAITSDERWIDQAADLTDVRPDRFRPGRPPYGSPASPSHRAFDPDFDIRDAIDDPDDTFDRQFNVASQVPKSCSTCRSFQASDDGERGWCMNDYSATYRQMVNSDTLACRSSIGDWWLAADSSWIPPTDVIQPETPRTDRLVARSRTDGAGASPNSRRVRTSKVG